MAVSFTDFNIGIVDHEKATFLIDYTGDLTDQPLYGQTAYGTLFTLANSQYMRVAYIREQGTTAWAKGAFKGIPRYFAYVNGEDAGFTGIYEEFTRTWLTATEWPAIEPETTYEIHVLIMRPNSTDEFSSILFSTLPDTPPETGDTSTDGFYGWVVLADIAGEFTTTAAPPVLNIGNLSVSQVNAHNPVKITQAMRVQWSGTLYWEVTRHSTGAIEAEWTDTIDDSSTAITREFDAYPLRRYVVKTSEDSTFPDAHTKKVLFCSDNFIVEGVLDPSASFDNVEEFWQNAMGLDDFSYEVGELPAGYVQYDHVTPRQLTVAAMGRELAKRMVAGSFERSDGSWKMIAKSLWPERDNRGTLTLADFKIKEHTLRGDLEEKLVTSSVRFQTYLSSNSDGLTSVYVTAQTDEAKLALYGETVLDQTGVFVYLPDVRGAYREIAALLAEPAPLVLTIDVDAVLDDDTQSELLRNLEPSYNMTFELDHPLGTVQHTGMLMTRRVFGNNGTRPPTHRLKVWIDNTEFTV